MPYILHDDRESIEAGAEPITVGDVNFKITNVCTRYLRANGESYQTINDLIGVLECAKLELYRRVAAPYEDDKCSVNGDVYPEHRPIGKVTGWQVP